MIRVLVVDDHAFTRAALRQLLGEESDVLVVGECRDGVEVVGTVVRTRPDVVLMDIRMPRRSGFEAARDLCDGGCPSKVVFITGFDDTGSVDQARQSGAVGYLLKGQDPTALITAVRTAASGGSIWPDDRLSVGA